MNEDNTEKIRAYHEGVRRENFGSSSMMITFQLTGECNFRCTYCYEEKQPEKMDLAQGLALIDKLFPIEDNLAWWNGYLRGAEAKDDIIFDFFGGECTLEIDMMEALCQHFIDKCDEDPKRYAERKKKFRILVQSNGSLLRAPKVEAFLRKWEPRILLGISLDGSKAFHDSCRVYKDGSPTWETVKDNLVWAMEALPNLREIKIKATTSPASLPYLYESYLTFKELGLRSVQVTMAYGCEWDKADEAIAKRQFQLILDDLLKDPHPLEYLAFLTGENLCNYEELARGRLGTCGSTGCAIALSSDNKLYNCIQFAHITMHDGAGEDDLTIGTVESGITAKGMEITDRILRSCNRNIYEKEKCVNCSLRAGCEYCPAFAYRNTGNMDRFADGNCGVEKVRMAYGLRYRYEMEKLRWRRANSI